MENNQELKEQLEKVKKEISDILDFYFEKTDPKTGENIRLSNTPPDHEKLDNLSEEMEKLEKLLKSN